ncbi:pentatricopeptide repeat-containing protein 2, mitochondrial isoform X4 [Cebus imitator]|uniref:pentatricopeptide repeat-containing protein 2, mitochondrial isoform X4 n=1 Tax=Cebus imitator TaxID=2715852 RepID=UPI00189BA612|nr:pentatricopeptide repeat-containing protein 2, mitochondrial isoform X4 [Cebus imitator]
MAGGVTDRGRGGVTRPLGRPELDESCSSPSASGPTPRLLATVPAIGMVRDGMAAALRPSCGVLLQALQFSAYPGVGGSGSACYRCPLGAKRYLLTDNIVKLKEFQHKKVAVACNLPGTKETYFRNLEEKLIQNKLILKGELITLLHLCESRDHVELAKNVIYRYHAENRNITVGEYKFGPLFMRLCYELDLEESAVELMKDQHLQGFFSDSTSFNILMDMLFIKGKYESALEVLIEMKNQDVKFTIDTYVLAFGICYKLTLLTWHTKPLYTENKGTPSEVEEHGLLKNTHEGCSNTSFPKQGDSWVMVERKPTGN